MVTCKVPVACVYLLLMLSSNSCLSSSQQNTQIITYDQATSLCSVIQSGRKIEKKLADLNFFTAEECDTDSNSYSDSDSDTDLNSPFGNLIHTYKDTRGNTVLHHACGAGHVNLTQELVKFQGAIETENNNGETPLFHVATYEALNELLKHNPNLAHQNNHNQIALVSHIIRNDTVVIKLLLQAMRYTSSSTLITTQQFPFNHVQSLDVVRILTKSAACCATIPQNQRIRISGVTMARQAFWSCMNTQPNINICDTSNETLLHHAAKENRYDIAEMLLKKSINIYAQSVIGQTALHIATYRNYPEFMALLLSHAIHLEAQGTPQAKALLLEQKDMDGSTALMIAVMENKTDTAHHLIDVGADIHTRNKYGHSLLHFVKDPILAQKLIDFGLNVNSKGIYGHTPLHFARNAEIAQLFIGNEANVNMRTIDGQTPLHLAKNAAIARILIKTGAMVNRQNSQGKTPLHCAVLRKNIALCKILLDNHADKYINDFACIKAGKKAENAIDCIDYDTGNNIFALEELEVILNREDRIPFWYLNYIYQKLRDPVKTQTQTDTF